MKIPKNLISIIGFFNCFHSLLSQNSCQQFECHSLNESDMRIGKSIRIPTNCSAPSPIPSNFSCTFKFIVPLNSYLQINVINSLEDADYIEFRDSLGYSRNLTTAEIANEQFFATAGNDGSLTIGAGPQGNSRVLLVFQWFQMPRSRRTIGLRKNANGKFVPCQSVHNNPVTFKSADENETLALNIAHSGSIFDRFDSFFIFDGPDTTSPVVGRMSSHIIIPFIPSNQSVTIIGLTDVLVNSFIIANYYSNIEKYRKYESALVINQQGAKIDSINQTVAITFLAQNSSDELFLTELRFNEIGNQQCRVRAISGTPSPISKLLIDYDALTTNLSRNFPQKFPASLFSIEITDCSIYVVISTNAPEHFDQVQSGRIGYAFTPSYLDQSLPSTLNFSLYSNSTLSFTTIVEHVNVVNDEQLTINVYRKNQISAMSIVVTGNQTGESAKAFGTSVNINFNGSVAFNAGSAKIRYEISPNFCRRDRLINAFLIFFTFFTGFL